MPQEPELEDGGTNEVIKMPYGGDGAFSIQCPGKEESLNFPEPAPTSSRKIKGASGNDKGIASDAKDRDADSRVKRSMRSILGMKRRSVSKVSNEISPPEREMILSENSGYSSSLDRSSELKVYHGALKMNLQLSPDMASRDAPDVDIHCPGLEPLKLETVLSQDPELTKTPDNITANPKQLASSTMATQTDANLPLPQLVEDNGNSSFASFYGVRDELNSSSSSHRQLPLPEKQNSKNSWWKNLTRRPRRRMGRGSKPDGSNDVDPLFQPGYEFNYPSDTSASQSFRKEPDEITLRNLGLHQDYVTGADNGNILSNGRSQSCRQDSSIVKKIMYNGTQSLRFDSSFQLLKTIHERQGPDRPQHR